MMTEEQAGFENKTFKRYVKVSLILHLGLFLVLTIKATFFTEPPIQFDKAIRVDMVGLPDKVQEIPPAPAPAPAEPPKPEKVAEVPKEEPKPVAKVEPPKQKMPAKLKEKDPEAINLEKTKSKQKQALEKLRQMEALDKIQRDLEKENNKKAAQALAKPVKFKGNVLSSGSELTGVSKLQAATYIGDVHKHILSNWTLPEYLKNRKLRTDVMVRFDEGGNILSKDIVRSSGNPTFDEMVLVAIQKSSPVPTPPAKFSKIATVEGFLFRFSHDL